MVKYHFGASPMGKFFADVLYYLRSMLAKPKRANTACSNCLECQGSCCFFIPWGSASLLCHGSAAERLLVPQHGIEDGQELSHASCESHLLEFATGKQMVVFFLDQRVVASCHQSSHVEDTANICTTVLLDHPTIDLPCPAFMILPDPRQSAPGDRKSTRLNSSHQLISYA